MAGDRSTRGAWKYCMNLVKGSYAAAGLILVLVLQGGMLYGGDRALLSGRISLDLSPGAGILYGTLGEYVYSGGSKKSELNWDTKPLYIFQLLGTLSLDNRYFFSLRYRYGVPWKSGRVTDTDWGLHFPGSITFSEHEGVTLLYHEIEGAFSALVHSRRGLTIRGGLSYLLMAMKTEARNGTLYEEGVETGTFDGPIIRYFQGYQVIPFRVDLLFRPLFAFFGRFSFAYTPFLFCSATDIHFLKDKQYDDRIAWGHFIEASLEASWLISKRIELFIGGQFRWIPSTAGDSRTLTMSTGFTSPWSNNTVGISLLQVSFLLGAVLHFNPHM